MERRVVAVCVVLFLVVAGGCATASRAEREKMAESHYKIGLTYLNDNLLQQATVEFRKALEVSPKDRDSHYALGHIYYLQEKYDEAQKEFKAALKKDSADSEAHNYLGRAYEKKSQWDEAIRHYKAALKNPSYSTPHYARYNLGIILSHKNDLEGSSKEFEEAVRTAPGYVPAYYQLGLIYSRMGKPKEAAQAFQKVIELAPDTDWAKESKKQLEPPK